MRINRTKNYIRPFVKNDGAYGHKIYGEPFIYNESIYPLSGESNIEEYGDRIFKTYKSTPSNRCKIKEGDVAYLEGASPFNEISNGQNANYKITSVRETKNSLLIIFERI